MPRFNGIPVQADKSAQGGRFGGIAINAPDQAQADAAPAKRSWLQDIGRAAAMTGRNVVQGAMSLPAMINDATLVPAINAVSKAVGSDYREAPSSQQLDSYMSMLGIPNPQPENATERVVSGIDRGIGGLLSGVGIGASLPGLESQTARGIGEALTSNLGAQTAATGAGIGMQEVAREKGASPGVQIGLGLLGGGAPALLGGAGRGLAIGAGKLLSDPSPQAGLLANQALDAGIPLKASQVSPSKVGKLVDSVTGQVPFSGSQAFQDTQQQAFNRAVGRTIGADASHITPDVFAAAKQRIGASYDDLASRINTKITPDVQTKLDDVLTQAQQFGADDSVKAISNALQRVKDQAVQGVLPGQAYKSLDSQLGTIAKNGGEKGNYAAQLRQVLRDAFTNSAGPEDQAQMQLANKQYANLKAIEPLVAADNGEGNISAAKLLGRVASNKAGKASMATGQRGDLGTLATIGQRFLKQQIPDSGTAQRVFAGRALGSLGSLGTGVAAGSMLGTGGGLLALGGTVASARGIQSALQSEAMLNALLGRKQTAGRLGGLLMLSADPTAQQLIQK